MPKNAATTSSSHLSIDASPTKELFIDMLTRDVALIPAIVDLADNSTDGARRCKPNGKWDGLRVSIDARASKFVITDNCGGIPVEIAQKYAFRFGRPSDAATTEGEVGRFGVGMKRGLFKIGRHFRIHSTTKTSRFSVTIDVDKWAREKEWQFKFDEQPILGGKFPDDDVGTSITVTKLHDQVREHFQESGFIDDLREELTSKLETSILSGLAVTVNSVALRAHARALVASQGLTPARRRFTVKGPTGNDVEIELWCGLGKPDTPTNARAESGWYVFCNGRMLLQADKTTASGWGIEDDDSIPAYHPQYNGFRGFAYLDAEDAADLPWNTTKTALDSDHPVYRRIRQEMIAIARPVINYFNKKKEENDALKLAGEDHGGKLQSLFDLAETKTLEDIQPRAVFRWPTVTIKKAKANLQGIAFHKPIDAAWAVRKSLGVHSWKEVGEELFEYYEKAELGK